MVLSHTNSSDKHPLHNYIPVEGHFIVYVITTIIADALHGGI